MHSSYIMKFYALWFIGYTSKTHDYVFAFTVGMEGTTY